MRQKVIKIGSSIGVVIPKPMAEEKGFKAGQDINLKEGGLNQIIIEPIGKAGLSHNIDPQILQWGQEFIDKNRELLERLKDK